MTHRREFLKAAAGSSAFLAIGSHLPQGCWQLAASQAQRCTDAKQGERVLVVVQLSGGNDGINTLVPAGDDEYYNQRFTLALPKGQLHALDDYASLHPSMSGISRLYQDGKVAVVQGVGYPQPNRSHFESMDLWHTAHLKTEQISTGWLGRYLDQIASPELVALHLGQEDQPLALAARDATVPTLTSVEDFRWKGNDNDALRQRIETLLGRSRPARHDLLQHIQASANSAITTSRQVEKAIGNQKSKSEYPESGLGRKLRSVAQLIQADLGTRVFYVTLDGFDTHSNQLEAHAGLLSQLSEAVTAFVNDLDASGDSRRVATMIFSEFGRRVKENASRGTDHGAAAPLFLVGGAVEGGMFGQYPSLTDLDDGDLKYNVDYRSVYATLLERWLGVESKAILNESHQQLELFA